MATQKAEAPKGKLGVLVVGLGAVTSTFMTGVLMTRKGLAKPVGSMTQYDKIRVGSGENEKYLHYKGHRALGRSQRHCVWRMGRLPRQRLRICCERRGAQG